MSDPSNLNKTESGSELNGNGMLLPNGQAAKGDVKNINKLYLFMNCLTISLGFMQFGIGMNSWSNSQPAFVYKYGWDSNEEKILGDVL